MTGKVIDSNPGLSVDFVLNCFCFDIIYVSL